MLLVLLMSDCFGIVVKILNEKKLNTYYYPCLKILLVLFFIFLKPNLLGAIVTGPKSKLEGPEPQVGDPWSTWMIAEQTGRNGQFPRVALEVGSGCVFVWWGDALEPK